MTCTDPLPVTAPFRLRVPTVASNAPVLLIALWMIRPPAPVDSIWPALAIVLAPVSITIPAEPEALIVPAVLLARIIWPPPMFPPPEMVLSTLVRVAVEFAPTIWFNVELLRVNFPAPAIVNPVAPMVKLGMVAVRFPELVNAPEAFTNVALRVVCVASRETPLPRASPRVSTGPPSERVPEPAIVPARLVGPLKPRVLPAPMARDAPSARLKLPA